MLELILYWLLSNRLNLVTSGGAKLKDIGLSDYSYDALTRHGFVEVSDVVMAYVDTETYSGVGKGTWDNFFECVRK